MRETIDKLYFLMLQSFRNEMGCITDEEYIKYLNSLNLLAIKEREETGIELGVSTAGYNNDSVFKSVPDENFWKEQDFLYTEPEKPEVFLIDKILEGENDGDLVIVFCYANDAKKAYDYLNKFCSRTVFYSDDVPIKEIDIERMGFKLYLKDDRRLLIRFQKAIYVTAFISRFIRFSKFGNYFVMEGE